METNVRLLDRIDRESVDKDLSRHRPSVEFKLDLPTSSVWRERYEDYPLSGGYNAHYPVEWTDGKKWLLRVRLPDFFSPPLMYRYIMTKVEITTMNFLADAGLAVPRAWSRTIPDNEQPTTNREWYLPSVHSLSQY